MKTKPIRVLVADDESAMRRGICASLSARGYALGEARTGEEAVLAVREQPHELEYLRTYIKLLRRKIEDDPARPEYITTEPWLGCRFRDPAEANPKATAPNENG